MTGVTQNMETPMRALRAIAAQPTRTPVALLAVEVELAEALVDEAVEAEDLLALVVDACAVVEATAAEVWLARGAVDCPAIWDRISAVKTPVMLVILCKGS